MLSSVSSKRMTGNGNGTGDGHAKGVGQGVWVAPWHGPRGEVILVAVTADGARLCERMLAPGEDPVDATEELWWLLQRHKAGLRVI